MAPWIFTKSAPASPAQGVDPIDPVDLGAISNASLAASRLAWQAEDSATYAAALPLSPSGDTTGALDTAAINAAANIAGHVVLGNGDWYVSDVGLTTSDVWLQGSGTKTVLHAITGHAAIVVTGPGNLVVSDLTMQGGTYGIIVNGAYDSTFRSLTLTGQTSGGVKINGDLATEQNWTDVTMRGVGGVAFDLERTTTIYTGSVYLDRVRLVEPAAGVTGGFRFNSVSTPASLNIAFLTQCVADNYPCDAFYVNNCAQVFVSQSWFGINGSAPSGSAAMHITGGFQHSYVNNYTYSGIASPTVLIDGGATGINFGGGHIFDGIPGAVALGLAGAARGGFALSGYQLNGLTTLTDTPYALAANYGLGWNGRTGEEMFSRLLCTSNIELTSGTLFLSYFIAAKTEVISTIECMSNTAASEATFAGYGLYTVADNGTLTLVAKAEQTANITLWGSDYQPVGGYDTKLGLTTGGGIYTKQAGVRYAVGALFVGTTAPRLIAAIPSSGTSGSNLDVAGTPLGALSGQKAGQTVLGTVGATTHTAASLSGCVWMPYFVLA